MFSTIFSKTILSEKEMFAVKFKLRMSSIHYFKVRYSWSGRGGVSFKLNFYDRYGHRLVNADVFGKIIFKKR